MTSMMAWPRSRTLRIVMRPSPIFGASPCLIEFSTSGCSSMLGTTTSRLPGSMSFSIAQLRAEADALDVEVLVDRLELLAQRDEVLLAALQPPQQPRELHDEHPRGLGLRPDERRDRRQRVEQEVRVDLAGERFDARRHQQLFLFLQPVLDARAVPDLDRDGHAEHRREDRRAPTSHAVGGAQVEDALRRRSGGRASAGESRARPAPPAG